MVLLALGCGHGAWPDGFVTEVCSSGPNLRMGLMLKDVGF